MDECMVSELVIQVINVVVDGNDLEILLVELAPQRSA